MKSITWHTAANMASETSYITSRDIGTMAIIHTDEHGQESLVDLAAPGESEEQAIAAYLRRVCEDDATGLHCAMITKLESSRG